MIDGSVSFLFLKIKEEEIVQRSVSLPLGPKNSKTDTKGNTRLNLMLYYEL